MLLFTFENVRKMVMRDGQSSDIGSESIDKRPVVSRNSCDPNVKSYHNVRRNGHPTNTTAHG